MLCQDCEAELGTSFLPPPASVQWNRPHTCSPGKDAHSIQVKFPQNVNQLRAPGRAGRRFSELLRAVWACCFPQPGPYNLGLPSLCRVLLHSSQPSLLLPSGSCVCMCAYIYLWFFSIQTVSQTLSSSWLPSKETSFWIGPLETAQHFI